LCTSLLLCINFSLLFSWNSSRLLFHQFSSSNTYSLYRQNFLPISSSRNINCNQRSKDLQCNGTVFTSSKLREKFKNG
jgi:hypothetical protein